MAYDSERRVTVLFGGFDSGPRSDTWEWDGELWVLRATTGPAARREHAMAYDKARKVTVLFGGFSNISRGEGGVAGTRQDNYMYDTWEWTGLTWAMRNTTGPSARAEHAMAYDFDRAVTVLYGGEYDSIPKADTWEWDGSLWTRRVVQGPSSRSGHSMAYDGDKGFTMLFGGDDGESGDDTWGWDGEKWWGWTATGPSARVHLSVDYDSIRNLLVLFGGFDGSNNGDTWELEWLGYPPAISQQPGDLILCQSTDAVFSVTAGGTTPLAYQWRKNGDEISDANDSSLVIHSVGVPDAGEYDVDVSNICGSLTSKAARLTVSTGHSITGQPQDRAELEWDDVTFWVMARGTPLLTYQWRKDGEEIPWATHNSLTFDPLTRGDAGTYDAVVTDVCGSIVSHSAVLTVIPNCNHNNIPDECDIDCGPPGGPCDMPGCGGSGDCNFNDVPDECEPDDEDHDGTIDDCDLCPDTPPGLIMGPDGCPVPYGACCFIGDMCIDEVDGDDCGLAWGAYLGDGLTCAGDPDGDGAFGCHDGCPVDPGKTEPGICGCGVPDFGDADGDGVVDCIDACPNTPPGAHPNSCGCPAQGACRFDGAKCWESTEWADCASCGGVYQGDGSTCSEAHRFGDFDDDADVDLRDFSVLQRCLHGTGPLDSGCHRGDIDRCGTIDLLDYKAFHNALTGP
jgi:hypothetical protein